MKREPACVYVAMICLRSFCEYGTSSELKNITEMENITAEEWRLILQIKKSINLHNQKSPQIRTKSNVVVFLTREFSLRFGRHFLHPICTKLF